jgi:hypothetical protein
LAYLCAHFSSLKKNWATLWNIYVTLRGPSKRKLGGCFLHIVLLLPFPSFPFLSLESLDLKPLIDLGLW